MSLVAKVFEADGIAVALGALMGLALGAGLSLVILSRFHAEEAKLTGAPQEATLAASAAVATTGRAVLIGGTGLIIALVLATIVGPTENLNSVGVGTVICGLLGIGAAVVVMPAMLSLVGQPGCSPAASARRASSPPPGGGSSAPAASWCAGPCSSASRRRCCWPRSPSRCWT